MKKKFPLNFSHTPSLGSKFFVTLRPISSRPIPPGNEKYIRLLAQCPEHLAPIAKLAYHTGMRRGEILNLKWERVDLKEGFIRLRPEDTKTTEGRLVPNSRELMEMFKAMPRSLPLTPVFTYKGNPMAEMKRSFTTPSQRAGIEGFTYHDLRHTFNTNTYRAGVPIPTIMKITGHKSIAMFRRYTTISPEDLKEAIGKI